MKHATKLFALGLLMSARLFAAGTGSVPWEAPLQRIATSLTGPVAFYVGIIGIFLSGAMLMWGGEMTEFGRRAAHVGVAVSLAIFATSIMSTVFGVSGACI